MNPLNPYEFARDFARTLDAELGKIWVITALYEVNVEATEMRPLELDDIRLALQRGFAKCVPDLDPEFFLGQFFSTTIVCGADAARLFIAMNTGAWKTHPAHRQTFVAAGVRFMEEILHTSLCYPISIRWHFQDVVLGIFSTVVRGGRSVVRVIRAVRHPA